MFWLFWHQIGYKKIMMCEQVLTESAVDKGEFVLDRPSKKAFVKATRETAGTSEFWQRIN